MNKKATVLLSSFVLVTLVASFASAYSLLSSPRRWFPVETPRVVHVDNRGMASVTDSNHGVTAAVGAANVWKSGASLRSTLSSTPSSTSWATGAATSSPETR